MPPDISEAESGEKGTLENAASARRRENMVLPSCI